MSIPDEKNVNKRETRQQEQNNAPEILTNPIYTPGFLREQIEEN